MRCLEKVRKIGGQRIAKGSCERQQHYFPSVFSTVFDWNQTSMKLVAVSSHSGKASAIVIAHNTIITHLTCSFSLFFEAIIGRVYRLLKHEWKGREGKTRQREGWEQEMLKSAISKPESFFSVYGEANSKRKRNFNTGVKAAIKFQLTAFLCSLRWVLVYGYISYQCTV